MDIGTYVDYLDVVLIEALKEATEMGMVEKEVANREDEPTIVLRRRF